MVIACHLRILIHHIEFDVTLNVMVVQLMGVKEECEICAAAVFMAGPVDETWNRRFVQMLCMMGREIEYLSKASKVDDHWLNSPVPHMDGWLYPYPSLIVPHRKFTE